MNTDNLWNEFLDKIKERITPLSYDTWFKDTKLYKLDGGTATIIVPLALHKKHLEENYIDDIEETFNSITLSPFNSLPKAYSLTLSSILFCVFRYTPPNATNEINTIANIIVIIFVFFIFCYLSFLVYNNLVPFITNSNHICKNFAAYLLIIVLSIKI